MYLENTLNFLALTGMMKILEWPAIPCTKKKPVRNMDLGIITTRHDMGKIADG